MLFKKNIRIFIFAKFWWNQTNKLREKYQEISIHYGKTSGKLQKKFCKKLEENTKKKIKILKKRESLEKNFETIGEVYRNSG